MNKRIESLKWKPSRGMMYLEEVPEGQRFSQPTLGMGTVISQNSGSVTVVWDKYRHENLNGVTENRSNVKMIIAPKTEVINKTYEKVENRGADKKETSRGGKNSFKSLRDNGRSENNKRQPREGENRK